MALAQPLDFGTKVSLAAATATHVDNSVNSSSSSSSGVSDGISSKGTKRNCKEAQLDVN